MRFILLSRQANAIPCVHQSQVCYLHATHWDPLISLVFAEFIVPPICSRNICSHPIPLPKIRVQTVIAHFSWLHICRRHKPTTSQLSSKLKFSSPMWSSQRTAYIPATYRHWQFWSCECAVQRWRCTADSPRKPVYWKLPHWCDNYFLYSYGCVRFKLTMSIYSYRERW